MSQKSPYEIAIRIRSTRTLTGLSRERFGKLINVSPATIRLWESPRKNSKGLTKKACSKLINGFKKANIMCSMEWLETGTGVAPYKIKPAPDIQNKSKNEKVNFHMLARSKWEQLRAKIPTLIPKKDYSLISIGTFGISPTIFGFGKTKKQHDPFKTTTFGIVPATYFKKRNFTEIEVLCEISEHIASLFVKYNKTMTPTILTRLTMETFRKVRSITVDPNMQMNIISSFISALEDGIKIDRNYLSAYV